MGLKLLTKSQLARQYLREGSIYVTIIEVKSPTHYVIKESPSMNASTYASKFLELEESMQKYYRSLEQVFFQLPVKNTTLVVEYEKKYYRAQVRSILNLPQSYLIKVYLVDYGKECSVAKSCLYEMQPDFMSVPFQVVDFKLPGLDPLSLVMDPHDLTVDYGTAIEWDPSASAFIEATRKVLHNAFIKVEGATQDCVYGTLHVTLKNGEEQCINDELVFKKFATQNPECWNNITRLADILSKENLEFHPSKCPNQSNSPEVPMPSSIISELLPLSELSCPKSLKNVKSSPPSTIVSESLGSVQKSSVQKLRAILRAKKSQEQSKALSSIGATNPSPSGNSEGKSYPQNDEIRKLPESRTVSEDVKEICNTMSEAVQNTSRDSTKKEQINASEETNKPGNANEDSLIISKTTEESNKQQSVSISNASTIKKFKEMVARKRAAQKQGMLQASSDSSSTNSPSQRDTDSSLDNAHSPELGKTKKLPVDLSFSTNQLETITGDLVQPTPEESRIANNETVFNKPMNSGTMQDLAATEGISSLKSDCEQSVQPQAQSLEQEEVSKKVDPAKIRAFFERSKKSRALFLAQKKSKSDKDNSNSQLAVTDTKLGEESCRISNFSEDQTKLVATDSKNRTEESYEDNFKTNKLELVGESSFSNKSVESQKSSESEEVAESKVNSGKLKTFFEKNRKDRALFLAQVEAKQIENNKCSELEIASPASEVQGSDKMDGLSTIDEQLKNMNVSCGNDSDLLDLVNESSDNLSNSPKSDKLVESETELTLIQQEPIEPIDFGSKSLFEKQKVPALCLGLGVPTPVLSLDEITFHPSIKKTLKELNFEGPSCIQSVVWPAAIRSRCLAAIAPPHSGKTVAYLLPIVANLLNEIYPESSNSKGPRAIIICSSWRKVQHVFDLLQLFLKDSKFKILTYFADGRRKRSRMTALMNGCDILISVPSLLLNFFKENSVCVNRCCHFILDDGANLLSSHMNEVKSIMGLFGEAIKLRPVLSTRLQILINSERWTKSIASFVDKFLREPLLLFTSFLEAAIYAKIPMFPHICSESDKNEQLVEIVKACHKRTIVCTQDIEKAFELHEFLQSESVRSFLVTEEMEHYISNGVIRDWKCVNSALPYCLIVTDAALTGMTVCDANYVIHYDVPEISRLQFGNRFSCIAEHFPKSEITDCGSHVLISETCAMQAFPILKITKRIGMDVPNELNDFVNKQKKVADNPNAPLCRFFKAFGLCKLPHCENRHHINSFVDQPKVIFREGHVDAKVTHIFDASHYCVRIIKYIPPDCEQPLSLSGEYAEMGLKLKNFYSSDLNKKVVDSPVVGGNYIIQYGNGFFYRVKIMNITSIPETNSRKITLLFRDDGFVLSLNNCELYEDLTCDDLPPPHAVEVFLCTVATPDSCLDWNPQANHFIKKLVMDKTIHGKVVLCLGETLWLHPLVLREKLAFNNDYLNVLSVGKSLKDAEFALDNEDHLPLLFKACTNKIQVPDQTSSRPPEKVIHEVLKIQVSYAFLALNVYEEVYVSSVVSPHQIYVQRLKFVDCLDELLDKINAQVDARKLKKCSTLLNGMHCIAPFSQDNRYYRALITNVSLDSDDVHLFFVDFGDSCCAPKDSIFVLPTELTLLPFQAIECELDGICAPHGGWSDKAADLLEDLTRDESNDMKVMEIKAYTKLTSYDAGNRYKVDIWNGEKTLSEQLLAEGLVDPADKFIPVEADNDENEDKEFSEDEPYGSSFSSDEDLPAENKDHHALFCAALSKMLLQNMSNSEATNEAINERRKNQEKKKREISEEEISMDQNVEDSLKDGCVLQSPVQALQRLLNFKKRSEEAKKTKPTISWWDSSEEVNLLFKLKDIQLYELDVKDDTFMFKTSLRGVDYFVEQQFYGAVHSKDCIEKNGPEGLRLVLKKQVDERWPRLIKEKKKFPYIKYDLEHIDVSDSEEVQEDKVEVPPVERSEESDSTDDERSIPEWKKLAEFKDPYSPLV